LLAAMACSHPVVPAKAAPPPLEFLGAWGTHGEGLGELVSPCCLATDSVGNVFIADVRGSSTLVHKFDREGHPLLAFYVDGAPRPSSITVDYGGAIYLTHRRPGDLYMYFPDGSHFRTIHRISGRALESPEGVALDENGGIYVTQADANRVLNINSRGRLLASWGTKGDGPTILLAFQDRRGAGWVRLR
jgi:DNA-binding beta-propeller fold protein YncE